MVKICPYCSEEQTALKNHVRLASGDGHGPSGQYPDDFEGGSNPDDNDDDPGGAAAAPAPGGGGTVTVEAVEETEEPQDLPEFEEEPEEEEEGIVAMPETELTQMLSAAREDGAEEAQEESNEDTEEDTSIEVDPVKAVEDADTDGWSWWAILGLFLLAAAAGVAWAAIKNAAENGRQQAHQLTQRAEPTIPGV